MKSHPRLLFSFAAAALLCIAPASLHAASRFWVGGNGGFGSSSNWSTTDGGASGASVPGSADEANFTLNNTYRVDFLDPVTNARAVVDHGNVTFDLGANTYTLTSSIGVVVGNVAGQTGRLTVRDGILGVDTNGDSVRVGFVAGSTGILTVTSGGQIGTPALRASFNVASNGTIVDSTGTVTVNENGRINGTNITVAGAAGATGTVTVTGPNAVADFSGAMTLGNIGSGTLNVTGGGTFASGSGAVLGANLGANGTATVSGAGSSWTMATSPFIGESGDGTLTISSGGFASSSGALLGNGTTGIGTATVTGAGSRWNLTGSQTIGVSGLGVMTIANGGEVICSSAASFGLSAGGEGRVNVTGAGSKWTLALPLSVGKGALTVSDGGEVSTALLSLGNNGAANSAVATVTGVGSRLTTTSNLSIADIGTGTLNVGDDAEVYVGGNLNVNDPANAPIGSLNLDGGSIYVAGNFTNLSAFNFTDGLLRVSGNFQPLPGANVVTINGADSGDLPTLDLMGSGPTSVIGAFTIGNNRRGQLLLRQGRVIDLQSNFVNIGAAVGGEGTVSVQSGAFLGAGPLAVGGAGTTAGGRGTLDISGGTVDVATLRLFAAGTVNLSGGTLAVNTLPVLDGQFNWTGGMLRFDAAFSLTSANVPKLLGLDGTLGPGQVLTSSAGQAVTLQTPLIVDGGSLGASTLINQSRLEVRSGSIGAVQNDGLIIGDGTIAGAMTNGAAGAIRVDAGKALYFTGTLAPNAGELNLVGGTLEFSGAVTNAATGRINGRGTLDFNGGLTNAGKMQFSGGPTDIYGNVSFTGGAGGGEMINSGGGNVVTFYDNVTHNGDEIRTSPTNTTVFFGNVTGAGPFTGTGAVRFEGTFSPGNSPAAVAFEGDLALGSNVTLSMELGGTIAGSQYDQLDVQGPLSLDGTLAVSFWNQFQPGLGDAFDLFDHLSLDGRFDSITLPPLAAGQYWDTGELYTSGTISVSAVPEPAGVCMWIAASIFVSTLVYRRRAPHPRRDRYCAAVGRAHV